MGSFYLNTDFRDNSSHNAITEENVDLFLHSYF